MQCPRGCGNIIAVVDALQNIFIRQFQLCGKHICLIFHLIVLHIKQVEFMEASALHRLLSVQEMMPKFVCKHNGAHRRVQVALDKNNRFPHHDRVCTLLLYKRLRQDHNTGVMGNPLRVTLIIFPHDTVGCSDCVGYSCHESPPVLYRICLIANVAACFSSSCTFPDSPLSLSSMHPVSPA